MSGRACSVGHCSGCSDGLSLSGSTCPARKSPAATAIARRRDHPFGAAPRIRAIARRCARSGLRPRALPARRRLRGRASVHRAAAAVVASSNPYTPTHTPQSPRSTSAPLMILRVALVSVVRPCPRASIAAASRIERSSASVITGTTTWRSTCRRDAGPPPRSARGAPHPTRALDELRSDGERDRDRNADLVQRRGRRLQQALRVREHVRGADAEDQRRKA